jgi:hypothetical protein
MNVEQSTSYHNGWRELPSGCSRVFAALDVPENDQYAVEVLLPKREARTGD